MKIGFCSPRRWTRPAACSPHAFFHHRPHQMPTLANCKLSLGPSVSWLAGGQATVQLGLPFWWWGGVGIVVSATVRIVIDRMITFVSAIATMPRNQTLSSAILNESSRRTSTCCRTVPSTTLTRRESELRPCYSSWHHSGTCARAWASVSPGGASSMSSCLMYSVRPLWAALSCTNIGWYAYCWASMRCVQPAASSFLLRRRGLATRLLASWFLASPPRQDELLVIHESVIGLLSVVRVESEVSHNVSPGRKVTLDIGFKKLAASSIWMWRIMYFHMGCWGDFP